MGMSFNNMRQWVLELDQQNQFYAAENAWLKQQLAAFQHQGGLDRTLLQAANESLGQYRKAHDDLAVELLEVKAERDRLEKIARARNAAIAEEAKKAERLLRRAEESQQSNVKSLARAKLLEQMAGMRTEVAEAPAPRPTVIPKIGDHPIAARATQDLDQGWDFVPDSEEDASRAYERADADTLSHWEWRRARSECRYGEDFEPETPRD
jgi:hypothetical protein